MTVHKFPGKPPDPTPRVEGKAVSFPFLDNRVMPHVYDRESRGGVCRRCGAEWPSRENCP